MPPEQRESERYFVLDFAKCLCEALEHLTPGWLLLQSEHAKLSGLPQCTEERRQQIRRINKLTDLWVLGNTALSVVCFACFCKLYALLGLVLAPGAVVSVTVLALAAPLWLYALWIIFGIVVYQFMVLVVHPYRTGGKYRIESHERSLLLALLNYSTIVFWFAFAYRNTHFLFQRCGRLRSAFGSLHASLATMSLLGADSLQPRGPLGHSLVLSQMAIGLFMTLVVLAQAVGSIQRQALAQTGQECPTQEQRKETPVCDAPD
jgi:hypothetical protein